MFGPILTFDSEPALLVWGESSMQYMHFSSTTFTTVNFLSFPNQETLLDVKADGLRVLSLTSKYETIGNSVTYSFKLRRTSPKLADSSVQYQIDIPVNYLP